MIQVRKHPVFKRRRDFSVRVIVEIPKDNWEDVEVFLSSVDGMFKNYNLSSVALNTLQEKVIHTK